ncbi:helix-turn-helix transcriptional regulator [Mycolicibacterium smegmatis]|uniref:DNA-binding protein n=2 Tax=Mycolicibacterium smegmatis (strain ATCC 700084 / mc(2)155) TaxID=246196 RepID=A0QV30_MYCS2|nr:helix-turn-helix transcriptional regulator [Mycolicibacterium smegmatis]ABK75390.1 DNA-binding protein [Mycolicibacterium smegmatis MC2 155]MCC3337571.1 helix-turn-helix transcriptional regulator [Mycolicibacterium smegmatis]MCO4192121.1 helix-turn-helix transcriptional regulator [Mycolicibacterium smegmatis]MCP2622437.1 helix-turn-helix transcriptional regulator [Mycolicibacterium smegmatis]MDF1898756.1 helix-turn-helix transcriptional regulator [Mycolicibacterium smegmatis]
MGEPMDRDALAEFLRRRREAIRPQDVGLPEGPRRRTAGLRREEVAQLTGMSVDYYGRLEQARGPQPSPQMLRALARALRLTDDERDHLYRLAGHAVPDRGGLSTHVRPALLFVLDRMRDAAAFVCTDTGIMLAQNAMAKLLMGDLTTAETTVEASMIWQWFIDPVVREQFPDVEHDQHSRIMVADLRAAWARRRTEADMRELVDGLLARSPEFAELWSRHEVAVRRLQRKTFSTHVGPITLDCEVLAAADGQQLVVLTPPAGSSAADDLRLLTVIGDQALG